MALELWFTRKEEGWCLSLGMKERIAQAWVNVSGGLRVFALYFGHLEGWTLRNEASLDAVVKQARTTGHPRLVAYDANVDTSKFRQGLWFKEEVHVHRGARCRSLHVSLHRSKRGAHLKDV